MNRHLELRDGIFLTRNGLGVHLESEQALVLADLHIGLEYALMGEGTYLPVLQYPTIENSILKLIDEYKPKTLIINGDFKHEFAKATNQEWTEILDLWDALKRVDVELELIRGNHDNFLINVLKQRHKEIIDPSLRLGKILITHGHKSFTMPEDINMMILAHEHPALVFKDDSGGKHKFKCYLFGRHDDIEVLVLPAYSPMAAGVPLNNRQSHKFMSEHLQQIDTDDFTPIVVDNGEMLTFPALKELEPVEAYNDWLDRLELGNEMDDYDE